MAARTAALFAAGLAASAVAAGVAAARETKADLQTALKDTQLVGDWIYDDIDAGFARARKEGKPLCVVFR